MAAFAVVVSAVAAAVGFAQTKPPDLAPQVKFGAVVQVDDARLRQLLRPKSGKPLLVNFWATWCDPCREEFPELVKIDNDYRGKIDFITVSLDDVADIGGPVVKFLTGMKAEMPAYLLVSQDESTIISAIARDWTGGLPFTILYNEKGSVAYFRQGKIKPDLLRAELNKLVTPAPTSQ